MGTKSSIAVQYGDGHVEAVYCHFDGYLGGVGKVLLEQHNSQSLAEALVALGDLRSITAEPLAYHRDRGEPWDGVRPTRYADRAAYLARAPGDFGDNGFRYLFADGQWLAWGRYEGLTNDPRPLTEAIAAKPSEDA